MVSVSQVKAKGQTVDLKDVGLPVGETEPHGYHDNFTLFHKAKRQRQHNSSIFLTKSLLEPCVSNHPSISDMVGKERMSFGKKRAVCQDFVPEDEN